MKVRLIALVLLVTGCSFFSRTKNTIYTIEPVDGTVRTVRGTPFAIESIELPPGFDRREIVVRQADQKLDVRGTQLWSASLQPVVLHTLAFDLARRLPEGMIVLPGQLKPAALRPIDVVFEEIVAGPDNSVTLNARWTLAAASHREEVKVAIASLDSAEVAKGMSAALAQLADRIAANL